LVTRDEAETFRGLEGESGKFDQWKLANAKVVGYVEKFLERSQVEYDQIWNSEKSIEARIRKDNRKHEIKEAGQSSFMINILWSGMLYGIYLSPFWLTGLYKMGSNYK
jgi:hypothetical protein